MLTILPFFLCFANAWLSKNGAVRLILKCLFQSSNFVSLKESGSKMDALLTIAYKGLNLLALEINWKTLLVFERSEASTQAERPIEAISFLTSKASSGECP